MPGTRPGIRISKYVQADKVRPCGIGPSNRNPACRWRSYGLLAIGFIFCRAGHPGRFMMPMIKPKLHHVTMKTSRLDEMIAWYALVVGARVQFRDKMAAWTTNDAANYRIAFLAVPGLSDDPEKVSHNGMHHCAFEYDSFADLMASFDRLRKAGVEPAFCLDHGMTISLYYKDPEGNFVELQSDNFSD
jgi:catechol 2,3-dioxygenase-like lactoylglutathione lyase family enzyme